MKPMKLNDKATLKLLREGIEENLKEFCDEYGIVITTGHISYDGDGTRCKVTLAVSAPNDEGKILSQYEMDWNTYVVRHKLFSKLEPAMLGQTIVHKGEEYELIGLAPKRRRFPLAFRGVTSGRECLMELRQSERLAPKGMWGAERSR